MSDQEKVPKGVLRFMVENGMLENEFPGTKAHWERDLEFFRKLEANGQTAYTREIAANAIKTAFDGNAITESRCATQEGEIQVVGPDTCRPCEETTIDYSWDTTRKNG